MRLLLARHGNTFDSGDKVVWVGARTDLPLTARGKEQASQLAVALNGAEAYPSRIVAGPLQRTREQAEIVAQMLGHHSDVVIDERLKEIDYGLWEGKSSEEIRASFPEKSFRAWNDRGIWPKDANWTPSEESITKAIFDLAGELSRSSRDDDLTLLVTSNGILKFFLRLVPGAFDSMAEKGVLKVSTGNICLLEWKAPHWSIGFWNRDPVQLRFEGRF